MSEHNKTKQYWSRRGFIKRNGLAMFALTLGGVPNFLTRAAAQRYNINLGNRKKTLVCIFQRGAMDGISAVQPINDINLTKLRPELVLSASKNAANRLLDLDGVYGLHPELQSLGRYFSEGRLAIIHGVGSPIANRSHFDAQDFMESGTPGIKGTQTGWLNRAIGEMGHDATPFRAVSFTPTTPRSLYGPKASISVEHLQDLSFDDGNAENLEKLKALYQKESSEKLRNAGLYNVEAVKLLSTKNTLDYQPKKKVSYPNSVLGNSLRQTAQLIKSGVGLEIAFAESGGWDTHSKQNVPYGGFTLRARDLALSIAAFWEDIDSFQDDVLVMTMTEFGRTIAQNGSFGTDHGRGSCSFVLGNHMNGGKVYGNIPELAIENLEDGRDLPVTTDFRSVFATVAQHHLGISTTDFLFPGWKGKGLPLFK